MVAPVQVERLCSVLWEGLGIAREETVLSSAAKGLEELLAFVRQHGALGINVAHSGTVIGVLWPEKFSDASLQLGTQMIRQRFPHLVLLMQTRLQGGGVQVAEGKCEEFVELFR